MATVDKVHLGGTFRSSYRAHEAYKKKAIRIVGEFACSI